MSDIRKVAVVGNYLPRKCGIATFTSDLRNAVAGLLPDGKCSVVSVSDGKADYDYPSEVAFEIAEQSADDYLRAAEYLNVTNPDVVCLQHEFGIYGGPSGSHVLGMVRRLRMPFVDPNFFKDEYQVEGRRVLLTFGLLSPNKGIEKVIEALPQIVAEFPDVVYVVLGATHPNLLREHGEVYRESLHALAERLGVAEHVRFFNQFVETEELKRFLGAADIYITPYLNVAQITSGTLAYAFGCGKAVISTPYWHAEELLADGRGVLVPFADSGAMAREVCGLLHDEARRHAMRKRAYIAGREMIWSKVAEAYVATFQAARETRSKRALKVVSRAKVDPKEIQLPEFGYEHLRRMTDSTGMLQHARFTFPNYAEGYCVDDNARALMLTVRLESRSSFSDEISGLQTRYASFVDHAFNPESGRFRNFMGYDRRWLEDEGSEDSQARALWALGTCVGRTQRRELRTWASDLFQRALPGILDTSSPRCWGFALLGLQEYLQRLSGDRAAGRIQAELRSRLVGLYHRAKVPGWHWFEDIVTYDNARLSQAVLASSGHPDLSAEKTVGLESLRWLVAAQRAEGGHFRPIGSNGFYRRGEARALFDQQPLEAHATVSACAEAFLLTGEEFWRDEARRAFGWFIGKNDLDCSLFNPESGGCRDGLHVDRVNLNEGAESTLAFLTALVEMQGLEMRTSRSRDAAPESSERSRVALLTASSQGKA